MFKGPIKFYNHSVLKASVVCVFDAENILMLIDSIGPNYRIWNYGFRIDLIFILRVLMDLIAILIMIWFPLFDIIWYPI